MKKNTWYNKKLLKLSWQRGMPPEDMMVKQVYGVAFDSHGRILLKIDETNINPDYNLAGGKPELFDRDISDTLKREFIEEVNTSLMDNPVVVGYQTVEGDNCPVYAQIRMACIINHIGERLPDGDNGKIYKRLLCSPKRAIELLSWDDIGEKLIDDSCDTAKKYFNITYYGTADVGNRHTYKNKFKAIKQIGFMRFL